MSKTTVQQQVEESKQHRPSPDQGQTAVPSPLAAGQWQGVPPGGSGSLRRASVLQMQRTAGNTAVMRQLTPNVQKEGDDDGSAPSEIKAGGNRVQVTAGGINITGPNVRVNAALADFSGIVRSRSLITDSVVASTYSPGAGNIW
ncbi:MAG: hypothetical protein ACE5FD_17895 [Anaerolineae bacterium]